MTVNPSDIQQLPQEGESISGAFMELLQDLAEGGAGGGITEITSGDMSVTITDPTGPTVDLSVSGGSQTWKIVRVPIAFDTAGLVADAGGASTGIVVWTPLEGETLYANLSYLSVTEAWDGETPTINWTLTDLTGAITSGSLATANYPQTNWEAMLTDTSMSDSGSAEQALFGFGYPSLVIADPAPLRAVVDDGSGGDPESQQGAGELVLVLLAAA